MPPENEDGSRPPQPEGAQGASNESSSNSATDQPGVGDAQPGEQTPPQGGDGKPVEGKKKPRGGFQRRIDELTAQNRQKDAQIERLLAIAEGRGPNGATPPGDADAAPDREKFEDYEQYLDARAEWRARREFTKLEAEREKRVERDRSQQAAADSDRTFRLKEAEARVKYDDYDEVVYESGAPITPAMADAIKASDLGADIAYYLGDHPDEATKIAQLTGTASTLAIGRIEARLSGEQGASGISKAPPPASPPTGGAGAPPNALTDKLDTAEWIRRRREEVNKLRQRH